MSTGIILLATKEALDRFHAKRIGQADVTEEVWFLSILEWNFLLQLAGMRSTKDEAFAFVCFLMLVLVVVGRGLERNVG